MLDKLVRGSGVGNDWCSFHAFSTRNFERGFREKSTCGGEKRFAAFKIKGTVRFLKRILHVVPDWTGLPFLERPCHLGGSLILRSRCIVNDGNK